MFYVLIVFGDMCAEHGADFSEGALAHREEKSLPFIFHRDTSVAL